GPRVAPDDVDDDPLSGRRLQVVVGHAGIDGVDDAHRLIHLRLCGWHFDLRHQTTGSKGQLAAFKTRADGQTVERVKEGHADLAHGGRPHHVFTCGQARRDRVRGGTTRAGDQATTREFLDTA